MQQSSFLRGVEQPCKGAPHARKEEEGWQVVFLVRLKNNLSHSDGDALIFWARLGCTLTLMWNVL